MSPLGGSAPRSVAVVAVLLTGLVTWRTTAGGAPAEVTGPPPQLAQVPDVYGDDLNHFIVSAAPDADADARAPGSAHPGGGQPDAGGPGHLRLVAPRSDEERAALAQLPSGSLLAADPDGALWGITRDGRVVPAGDADGSAPAGPATTGAASPDTVTLDPGLVRRLRAVDGVVEVRPLGGGHAAVATSLGADELAAVEGVAHVEEDLLLELSTTNDPRFAEQWMLDNTGSPAQAGGWSGVADADLDAPVAWRKAQGAGVVVAVVDTGVALDHPDLSANLWRNVAEVCGNRVDDDTNGYVDDCEGWSFGNSSPDPRPDPADPGRHHGSHVAGIVAATTGNGVGVAGVAPAARIMPLRVSNANGSMSASSLAAAIRYAADNGAHVINLSLGTGPGTPRSAVWSMEQAIAHARSKGVVVVAAAGNHGVDISPADTVWPAGFSRFYDNVVTVGATTNRDTRASFSNHGSPLTVYAPGWFVLSTLADGYGQMSGTSMATPAVAGVAALIRSSGLATRPEDIRARLVSTADIASGVGPRANAARAVGVTDPDGPAGPMTVAVAGLTQLRADEPATLAATVSLTADAPAGAEVVLSLATAQDGQVYAVEGVQATIDGRAAVTDVAGSFGAFAVPAEARTDEGWTTAIATALPAGRYALVTELRAASTGASLDAPAVVVFDVVDPSATTSTTATGAPSPTTAPPGGSPTTLSPGPGASTSTPGTPTTSPGAGSAGPTTTAAGPTTSAAARPTTSVAAGPTTTVERPGGGGAPTPPPSTTPGSPAPPTPPTTATDGATTTVPAGGTTVPRPTTTAGPRAPVDAREWVLAGISPNSGPTSGGTSTVLSGVFPTDRDVHVWFGTAVVTGRSFDGRTVTVATPSRVAGLVDVTVRFSDGTRSVSMTLRDAFAFVAPGAPTPHVPQPPPAVGGPVPTTTPSPTPPAPSPPPPSPTTSTPAPTSSTAPPPLPAPPPPPGPTAPPTTAPPPVRGGLTLRTPAAGSAVARLGPAGLTTGSCTTSPCLARRLA